MMPSIYVGIASYADADLYRTLDSAIRMSSGTNKLHFGVCEQVTRYADAYLLSKWLPDHVKVSYEPVGLQLIGIGGARRLAEAAYSDEDIQVQVDSHTRFDGDWDVSASAIVDRVGVKAIVTGVITSPWKGEDRVPVTRFDKMVADTPTGYSEMVEPSSGRLAEVYPARTVQGAAMVGAAWCAEVPADPHIMFNGDEPTLAARLWTHGYRLLHGRVPWQTRPAGDRPHMRPWERPEWKDLHAIGSRRVKALLTGEELPPDDPAAKNLDRYGLGTVRTLAAWYEYSGLDYCAGTVTEAWP